MPPDRKTTLIQTALTSATISCTLSAFFAWWGTDGEKFWNSFWSGWAMAFPLAFALSLLLQGPVGRLARAISARL